jgi:hypothetical protein
VFYSWKALWLAVLVVCIGLVGWGLVERSYKNGQRDGALAQAQLADAGTARLRAQAEAQSDRDRAAARADAAARLDQLRRQPIQDDQ